MTSTPLDVERATTARPSLAAPSFHHVGVQTTDLANSIAWYQEFFGATEAWSLSRFSELTLSRLPGIGTLVELVCGEVRFHVFDRTGCDPTPPDVASLQYQHLCLRVRSLAELRGWREHWLTLYRTGKYKFVVAALPTEIVVDDDGVASCYLFDVNGLEFELSYIPDGVPSR